MLTLERLRNPTDAECDSFDLAEMDLACAAGLPGSECLDASRCLAWIDHAAAWARFQTSQTWSRFQDNPAAFDNSPATFRLAALMSVLWRGLGIRYNPERITNPDESTDSGDDFIHGVIQGQGGTCASLPVLFAAVGRRLGYPIRLVLTESHQFCRWDDPEGERINIEINNTGLVTHPDEYYLTWPRDIRNTDWRNQTLYLQSLTARQELAHTWAKRAFCWDANGRLGRSVDAFATACSLVTNDHALDRCLLRSLKAWNASVNSRIPKTTPRLGITFPPRRRYPGIPIEAEREIIRLEVVELLLDAPPTEAVQVEVRVFK